MNLKQLRAETKQECQNFIDTCSVDDQDFVWAKLILALLKAVDTAERALEFYGDPDKYFKVDKEVNLQKTTAAFKVDDPLSLPDKAIMRSHECSAQIKADMGKRARAALAEIGGA